MVRLASVNDLLPIAAIYNQAIRHGFQTCFTEDFSVEKIQDWYEDHRSGLYPVLVYEDAGQLTGWASVSPYRKGRGALADTVEISYFIHRDFQGKGYGRALLEEVLKTCIWKGFHAVVAVVLSPNILSIQLLEKSGFEKWGRLPEVAVFSGKRCDQILYGKLLIASR